MKKIAIILNAHSIKLTMIVGKHDKIITARNMQRLLQYLPYHHLEVVDTGHNGLIARSASVLRNAIRQ